ncbi:MAG: hypothetical protein ACOCX0_01005 [Bacteroidota bacterium]
MEKLNFQFTVEETNLILTALGEMPAKKSMNLMLEIQRQGSENIEKLKAKENDQKK